MDRWLSSRELTLGLVLALFAAITALRFWIAPGVDGVTLLYTLPVALAAVRFGALGGLAAGALGLVLYAIWVQAEDVSAGAFQYCSRAVAFGLLGVGLGGYSSRLHEARQHARTLLDDASESLERERSLQEELRNALALHAEAENVSGFGSWLWDLESDTMRWSAGLFRLLGLEPGAVTPTFDSFVDFVHPDDRGRVAESRRRALEDRETSIDEFRIIRPDGEERAILGAGKAVIGADGRTRSILGTAQDITSRAAADHEIRSSEARYRALMEHAPEAIVVLDVEKGRFTQVNENAVRLFKLTREELLQTGPAELSPPRQPDGRKSAEASRAYIEQAVGGATPSFEWVHRAADGRDVICEVRLVRLPDSERMLVRGSVTDVTARKRMERRLGRAEAERELARRARDLHRVTETALAHLSLDELLPELLNRLRDILEVDNAAVLLADDRGDLTVEAAHGIEQAVVGMRLGAGQGFAGRVVTERRPITLYGEELRKTVVNPVLQEVRALLGLPLIVEDRVVGVLHVGSVPERTFTDEEISLLQLAADRAALGIEHARVYERERATAETLQRSLLPERLPDAPGLELAASYQAAGQGWDVGGDFYDAFEVAAGHWVVVVGDACGKGPDAAALTALARYTIRAEATRDSRPATLLRRLNRAILQQRSDYRFCTVACALIEMDVEQTRLTISAGGHPLPLVLRASGEVEEVGRAGDLVGAFHDASFSEVTTTLGAGDTVVFYTDGLLEAHAPQRIIEPAELSAMVEACAGLSPEEIVQRLGAEATGRGAAPPRDDLAIVAVSRLAVPAPVLREATAGRRAD